MVGGSESEGRGSGEKEQIAASEATFAYLKIKHSHSYNSAACGSNIFTQMFPDSNIAKKFTCGRTKCTKIGENVLAPASKEMIIADLIKGRPFAIGTEMQQTRETLKRLPFIVRYFTKMNGICTKLLSSYD